MSFIDTTLCKKDKIIFKNKKEYLKERNLKTSFHKKNSKVKYISEEEFSKLNIFVRQLVDFSSLNLNTLQNKINIYYPQKTSEVLDEVMFFFFKKSFTINKVNENHKKNHFNAANLICDFLDLRINEVSKYEDADIVVSFFNESTNFNGVSTYPYEMDLYKILNNKLYIFYSNIDNQGNSNPGSFLFLNFIHHILHCFGLFHPDSEISSECNSPGIFYMNSHLATVMFHQIEYEKYPQTLMPLDIEALRFLYKDRDCSNYNRWLDYTLSKGIVQTLVNPVIIDLKPEKFSRVYNLTLDPFSLDSGSEYITTMSLVSRQANDKFGASLVAFGSYIEEVKINFEEINIYASQFVGDTKIIVSGNNVKIINIYLKGFDTDYHFLENRLKTIITNLSTNKRIIIDNNGFTDLEVEIYLMGNKIMDKFPEKFKYEDNFGEDKSDKSEKDHHKKRGKTNMSKMDNKYFSEIKIVEPPKIEKEIEEPNIPIYTREKISPIESKEEIKKIVEEITSDEIELPDKEKYPSIKDGLKLAEESPGDVGENIIKNLQEEHYDEIIDSFFKKYPGLVYTPDEKLIQLLNLYGISYISKRFKNKLKGKNFPMMAEILVRKKNELKNNNLFKDINDID